MDNLKLFVSYSWSSPEHEQWVLRLATELRDSEVDVVLDKWDLKVGHDAYAFMEKMVTDPTISKVIIVCDRKYVEKADGRSGGVGTETQIISKEVYDKTDQNKFVAIVSERDEKGKPYLPTYYRSRIYVDLSDDDLYAKNFEQLLRWIYDKPLYIKPELGKKPSFLSDSDTVSLGTSAKFKRALDAIRSNKDYAGGALNEYLDAFASGLEKFRISDHTGEFDERVVESIEQFIPYRNEALEVFLALAQYRNTKETWRQLHRFFEQLIPYLDMPEGVNSWRDENADNFKFIVQELFLYCAAAFIKYECFNAVGFLLKHRFYVERHSKYGRNTMQSFWIFRNYLRSLDLRNSRLQLRTLSLHADMLKQRCSAVGITFDQLMQADFVLFLRDCIDTLREGRPQYWWPDTLVYKTRGANIFEIFSRAESLEFFEDIKIVLNITLKSDLISLWSAFDERKLKIPQWEYNFLYPRELMGFDKLATQS